MPLAVQAQIIKWILPINVPRCSFVLCLRRRCRSSAKALSTLIGKAHLMILVGVAQPGRAKSCYNFFHGTVEPELGEVWSLAFWCACLCVCCMLVLVQHMCPRRLVTCFLACMRLFSAHVCVCVRNDNGLSFQIIP